MNTPSPAKRTQAQQDAISTAINVIKGIDDLNKNEFFRSFMGANAARAHALAISVLEEEKWTPDERERLRNIRTGIMEVLLYLEQDRAGQISVLASFGIDP